jgi:prepilin-type N-terminal cleavage/methylation domain-containing protein
MLNLYPKSSHAKKGFTLIELMVAITILAVVSSIGFVTYSNSQIAARDGKRKQDLRAISTALELYYQTNKRYPCTGSDVWVNSSSGGNWITDIEGNSVTGESCGDTVDKPIDSIYINIMPKDPKNTGGNYPPLQTTSTYTYGYRGYKNIGSCSTKKGQFYLIAARLENTNDPDRNAIRGVKDCEGSALNTGNWSGLYILTSE